MSLVNIAEHRIKLLLKKSEGKATQSDFKQLNRLAEMLRQTTAKSVMSEEDKEFLAYAEKLIAELEGHSIKDAPDDPTDLDFTNK